MRGDYVGIFDRVALSVSALLLTALALCFLLSSFGWLSPIHWAEIVLNSPNGRIILGIVSGLLFLAGVRFTIFGFRKSPGQAVVHDSSLGEIRISLVAVRNLVNRVASRTPGVKEVRSDVKISPDGDGVLASLVLKVAVDANLPELADKLQKAISSYVKEIVGIDVQSVTVSVADISLEARR